MFARPVSVSIVLDAKTEMKVINGLDNGFRWSRWSSQSRGARRGRKPWTNGLR